LCNAINEKIIPANKINDLNQFIEFHPVYALRIASISVNEFLNIMSFLG